MLSINRSLGAESDEHIVVDVDPQRIEWRHDRVDANVELTGRIIDIIDTVPVISDNVS